MKSLNRCALIIYAALFAVLGSLGIGTTSASAQTPQAVIADYATYIHDLNFSGGSSSVSACHKGRQAGVIICRATITGTPNPTTSLPQEPLICLLPIYAWHGKPNTAAMMICVAD